jgi:hypothetical protein
MQGMTAQAKKFIELSDVLALHFVCKECGATMSISPREYQGRKKKEGSLQKCPLCGSGWALVGNSSCEPQIAKFVDALLDLTQTTNGGQGSLPVGFALHLEVKDDNGILD